MYKLLTSYLYEKPSYTFYKQIPFRLFFSRDDLKLQHDIRHSQTIFYNKVLE